MELTREKIEQMRADMQTVGDHCACGFRIADLRALLTLAERALEPQGQTLPVAWQVWWGLMEKKPVWPPFATEDEAKQRAAQIKSNTEIRPLYASQLALPAGPVPEEDGYEMRKAMMEGEMAASADGYFKARTNLMDTSSNRHLFRAGFERGYEIGNCDRSIGTSLSSPAVAQPVADERAASILRDLVKLWDSENISEDDFNEEMVRIENAARAALCQPAEEGDKE